MIMRGGTAGLEVVRKKSSCFRDWWRGRNNWSGRTVSCGSRPFDAGVSTVRYRYCRLVQVLAQKMRKPRGEGVGGHRVLTIFGLRCGCLGRSTTCTGAMSRFIERVTICLAAAVSKTCSFLPAPPFAKRSRYVSRYVSREVSRYVCALVRFSRYVCSLEGSREIPGLGKLFWLRGDRPTLD
jgi:hypothetical protein